MLTTSRMGVLSPSSIVRILDGRIPDIDAVSIVLDIPIYDYLSVEVNFNPSRVHLLDSA